MRESSFENCLLINAIEYKEHKRDMKPADEFSVKTWWERKIERAQPHQIFFCLLLVGLVMRLLVPWHFWQALGEATIIAAILILFVDPMLKGRLLREASQGIFHYLLGYDQQPEIKERLRSLVFGTKLFRKNFYLKCVLIPESGSMRLDMDVSFEVFNPTDEGQTYTHATQFEKVEHPKSYVMALISEAGSYSKNNVPFNPKDGDIEVLEAKAGPINIEPDSKKISYRFSHKLSLSYPLEFFHAIHVGTPTIGMTLEVVPPKGFRVTASQTPTCTDNIWQYDGLFMPGDHKDFRWEREISN
jgi:hypothetical protein